MIHMYVSKYMTKQNQSTPSQNHQQIHDEFDALHTKLAEDIHDKDIGDIIITTEESITITLFDDTTHEEGEEDDFETDLVNTKKKKVVVSEEDGEDFDSYFFEE